MTDGYYWARHLEDNTTFVVLREGSDWYAPGIREPIVNFDQRQIIKRIEEPNH